MGAGDHAHGLAHFMAEHMAQAVRVLRAAQRIDQQHVVAIDERGGDGFDGLAHEHHHIGTQRFYSHGGRLGGNDGIVASPARGGKRIVLAVRPRKTNAIRCRDPDRSGRP
ncbi:hypothetical protein D9M68_927980 [compost metagenome]